MKKFGIIFSGQGSQYVGMGKEIYQNYSSAKKIFDEASESLSFDVAKLCFEGSMEELTKTENTQPALLTMSVAAYQVYKEEIGIRPDYFAGHSLGEISALTCAEAIPFYDAVKIARSRGLFMQEAVSLGEGAMAAVGGVDQAVIEQDCEKASQEGSVVVLSNINSPSQLVISGHKEAVDRVSEFLKARGAHVTLLQVSAPFHSPLMQPAADQFSEELKNYQFGKGKIKIPVLSNVNAQPYQGKENIVDNLTKQIVAPVKWQSCMAYLKQNQVKYLLEIGPGKTLKNLVSKNTTDIESHSFDKDFDLSLLKKTIHQFEKSKLYFISRSLGMAVSTKNYNENQEEYQKGVIESYKKMKEIQAELESQAKQPSDQQIREIAELLQMIFITKKTPQEEQVARFQKLFAETDTEELFQDFTFTQVGRTAVQTV
ncbi:[acyl-carrier-protein] S-malonyltransferase [Brevibacillus laterosporus]|uniref:[acyl-carrier-protein] S-malonyltransferase n=1 Tax=Brevibacillus laterosporus TaxID=1465 RepID=A0A518VAY4_BRELA|nr:[acyl-carrier-protein] S-malonyltransferase [Brevibacillus laterosporus]